MRPVRCARLSGRDDTPAQLTEDDRVDGIQLVRRRDQDLEAPLPAQVGAEKVLLHRVAGAQQADPAHPPPVGLRPDHVADVYQRDADRRLHLGGDLVHGVGADRHAPRPGLLQPTRGSGQMGSQCSPLALLLERDDGGEVERVKADRGGAEAALREAARRLICW